MAWIFCKKQDDTPACPQVITRWKSNFHKNSDRQKVPSAIHYGENGKISWGYDIEVEVDAIEWFKLLLLEECDIPNKLKDSQHLKKARHQLRSLGKNATEVVTDYLRELWNHTIAAIKKVKGSSLVDGTPIEVILTIPAIWKSYAKELMTQAANRARILNERVCGKTILSFITEPEAAAIATLPELKDREDIEVGANPIVWAV